MKCGYCNETYAELEDGDCEPECDCAEQERKREAARDSYWERKIDEARGK